MRDHSMDKNDRGMFSDFDQIYMENLFLNPKFNEIFNCTNIKLDLIGNYFQIH